MTVDTVSLEVIVGDTREALGNNAYESWEILGKQDQSPCTNLHRVRVTETRRRRFLSIEVGRPVRFEHVIDAINNA